jgi:hypothetical protein
MPERDSSETRSVRFPRIPPRSLRTLLLSLIVPAMISALPGCSKSTSTPTGNLNVLVCDCMTTVLSGATVTVTPEGGSTTTNTTGRALFPGLPVGEYTVEVSCPTFETATQGIVIDKDQTHFLDVVLTGKPANLNVTIRRMGQGVPGVTVRVWRQLDDVEIDSGITGEYGLIEFEGLTAQPVTVTTDTLDNMMSVPQDRSLVGLETTTVSIDLILWASLFTGEFAFGNEDAHAVTLLEWTGTGMVEILPPAYFTGNYRLMSTAKGDLLVLQLGNPSPFEMAGVFSPLYTVGFPSNVIVPTQNSVITSASPRDDAILTTDQFPITLACQYPTTFCVYNEWEVDYWWYDGTDWNWTMVQLYQPPSATVQWSWDGSISSSSSLFGQTLPADPSGEYYSWYLAAGYNSGGLSITPDYFFKLATPAMAGARPLIGQTIGPQELAALERRIRETWAERAESALERSRIGGIQP